MRFLFQSTYEDLAGRVVTSGTIAVTLTGTSTVATIYSDDGTGGTPAISGGTVTSNSSTGKFEFYVDTDDYATSQQFRLTLSKTGFSTVVFENINVFHSGDAIITKTVEITNSEIKALVGTPKELVAAPGANKLIEFLSIALFLDYGSEVLAEPSAPDDLAIEYDDGSGTQIVTWDTTGFITNNADTMEIVHGASVGGGASAIASATNVNKNLVLINTGGDYTGNASLDTTITVKVQYAIHTTGL